MSVGAVLAASGLAYAGSEAGKELRNTNGLSNNMLTTINAIKGAWAGGAGKTLVTASSDLRVEPLILVDERVSRLPYATDLMEAMQRLFTSYYLLAVASENTIGSCTITKRIGKFAPDRNITNATAALLSVESYQFGLPFPGEPVGFDRYNYSPEAFRPHAEESFEADNKGSNIASKVMEIQNLSIGQLVNVEIVHEGHRANIPVMVRLRALGASPEALSSILGLGMKDNTMSGRWLRFKVGDLSLKDLITTQDMIDDYRRAVYSDKTGYFRTANKQANKGLLATMLTGTPSIGALSSMAVISKQTATEIERKYLGDLNNYAKRQEVFDKSMLMLLMVVDDDSSTVTVYTRDIEKSQTYWLKDIQKSSKGSNNDLGELLKAFLNGNIPGRL